MAVDVDRLLAAVDIVAVIGSRVALKKKGKNYLGLCPFHNEDSESFTVEPEKGFYHCFGCGANGDAIGFLRELDGIGFLDACKLIGDTSWQPIVPVETLSRKDTSPPSDWISQKPPERINEPGSFRLHGLGEPVAKWAYRDAAGDPLMWIARYKDGNKKSIRAFSYGTDKATVPAHWACRHASKPRPLYGLDRLAARPNSQVVVLEGEGKCDSAGRLLPQLVNMAWPGGAQAVKNADWSPLYGASVVLIPDADEPGRQAVKWISEHLLSNGSKVKIADPEKGLPDGWNLDDAERDGWTKEETIDWVRARVKNELPVPRAAKNLKTLPQEPANPPANVAYINEAAAKAAEADRPKGPEDEPLPPAFSEDALTDAFARQHARDLRYVAEWGAWFQWGSTHWREDKMLAVMNLSRFVCRTATAWAAPGELTPSMQRNLTSAKTIGNVERLSRSVPEIAATIDQWDTNVWALCTPGGTIDLMTGKLAPSKREDYCSKRTAIGPTNTGCPLWMNHLKVVTNGNDSLIAYLHRLAGYALTGVTTEHVLAFFYGTGANGKGIFLNTLRSIVGEYGTTAPMDAFMETRQERHSTEIAQLRGARLVTIQETDESRRWNEARILHIAHADPIKARFMRQDDFEFVPQCKLLFAGNHKPSLKSANPAMRRTLHIVPFTVTIPEEKRDLSLSLKLKEEWGGILHWMMEGCVEWQRHGLKPPTEVRESSADYIDSEDTLLAWIEECCERGTGKKSQSKTLYKNWCEWCENAGERPCSAKAFIIKLRERNLLISKSAGYTMVEGLDLKRSGFQLPDYQRD
jgi:putative DNA primase/helicase